MLEKEEALQLIDLVREEFLVSYLKEENFEMLCKRRARRAMGGRRRSGSHQIQVMKKVKGPDCGNCPNLAALGELGDNIDSRHSNPLVDSRCYATLCI